MRIVKTIIFGGLISTLSSTAFAGVDCSIETIEKLTPADQLERYTTCSRLMESRLSLLKTNKEIENIKVSMVPNLSDGLPMPQGGYNQPGLSPYGQMGQGMTGALDNTGIPSFVESVEIINGNATAIASWGGGRAMKVRKGSHISDGVTVLNVSIDGITVSSPLSKKPVFIGRGASNSNIIP